MITIAQSFGDQHWVHTLGNIACGDPELLVFTKSYQIERYKAILADLSRSMQDTGAAPTENRIFTFQGLHFYPVAIDKAFVFRFAFLVMEHYRRLETFPVLQLIVPDQKGAYPFDRDYEDDLEQPLLKYN